MSKLETKNFIVGVFLIIVASLLIFSYELNFWRDWMNDIKNTKGMLWIIRIIGVFLISLGIIRVVRKLAADSNPSVNLIIKAGLGKSAVILAFAWALLIVAFVGFFTLPMLILEGIAGAIVLILILYSIGKRK